MASGAEEAAEPAAAPAKTEAGSAQAKPAEKTPPAPVVMQPKAAAPAPASAKVTEEPIYGSQMMTPAERNDYRMRMRAATTDEARQKLRLEHHTLMQERAKERGMTLPDMPPAGGGGMGPGMGGGMGGGKK
ncbi:hypothetical protein Plut_1931 [Pelodictyon luteolum DSM 273]|uniref:Uncharacterized protein n=2 Tax=Pelodictyon luteolum TaxID=1100 RepID=Q3B1K8_CHLL3|nr:hypothetical protein Plut_1931 [Pelodictyon luteolum DSM 273]